VCGVRRVTEREVERTLKKLCIWGGRDRERGEKKNPATGKLVFKIIIGGVGNGLLSNRPS